MLRGCWAHLGLCPAQKAQQARGVPDPTPAAPQDGAGCAGSSRARVQGPWMSSIASKVVCDVST